MAYLQLMRLPNVFTAMADIFMGFLFAHRSLEPVGEFVLLLAASSGLYTAGMVLNDLFDYEVDRRERRERPLPSGRISRPTAMRLAAVLMVAGCTAAWAAGWRSGLLALLLVALIFLYDGLLKATAVGPVVMGGCRAVNVLLGMSTAAQGLPALTVPLPAAWQVAGALALYIAGVTWFARREAQASSRRQLGGAAAVINAAFAALALAGTALTETYRLRYWLLLGVVAWTVDRRALLALISPQPRRVQAAVKTCLLSVVLLDATVVCGVVGPWWALAVAVLTLPAAILGRWVYST